MRNSELAPKSIALLWMLLSAPALLATAEDPFWGNWKLNREKTLIGDRLLTVQDLGSKLLKITFREVSYTITADGKEHQVHVPATALTLSTDFTESILQAGGNKWKFVMKQDGRVEPGINPRGVPVGSLEFVIFCTRK
jgi:hypothetical protein